MFNSLTDRFHSVFESLRQEVRLTPEAVEVALKDIRVALLEADVNFKVVKAFVNRVRGRAIDREDLRAELPEHRTAHDDRLLHPRAHRTRRISRATSGSLQLETRFMATR